MKTFEMADRIYVQAMIGKQIKCHRKRLIANFHENIFKSKVDIRVNHHIQKEYDWNVERLLSNLYKLESNYMEK